MSGKLSHEAASSESTVSAFLRRQFATPKPLPANIDLSNQVAIITGSNTGVGFEAARQLLRAKLSHMILAVRSQSRGDAAAKKLQKEFPDSLISVWLLDMISHTSIHEFADRCAHTPRLDMVILNAGSLIMPYTAAPETGHEMTMQVNYLSTALLASLLVPVLKKHQQKPRPGAHSPPILSLVGSDMQYGAIPPTTGPIITSFDGQEAYAQPKMYESSKHLLVFFTERLAKTVAPEEVLINVVNPGMTKGTSFWEGKPFLRRQIMAVLMKLLARDTEVGASTYVDAVTQWGPESHGSFLSEWQIKP